MNMMNEKDIEQTDSRAVDFADNDAELTDEQLEALRRDPALRRDVQLLTDLKAALRAEQADVDVEARLSRFHQAHPTPARVRPLRRYVVAVLAAAAVFVGVLLVVTLRPSSFTQRPAATSLDESTLFTADAQQQGISLTNEQGEQVMLSPTTQQRAQVTLTDFRRVLADSSLIERVTLNVPYGKSADVVLPDGSVCCLHPGSRVVFPTAFKGAERDVMVEGEAYFRVAKAVGQPFVIHTPQGDVRDYGTEFSINTREADGTVSVVLVEGSVGVKPTGAREQLLQPGQKCVVSGGQCAVSEVDLTPYQMWRDGYLYFDNVELRDIMLAVGRNFNMTVEFSDTAALHLKMRFITERNNGVDAAIDQMNRMKKVSVRRIGSRLLVE